ncbi:hypothetical protein Tco_0888158 [Tanacetum coccineum]
MEQAMEQHRLESKTFEVKMNQVLNENERLLEQVISKDIVNTIVNSSVDIAYVNVHECEKCLKLETELLNKKDFEKSFTDKLFKKVKLSTSASRSQPSGNTKKDKFWQTPSSTQKNKVEAHPRKVKCSLKNKDCVIQPKGTAHVQHSKLNANSELNGKTKKKPHTPKSETPIKKLFNCCTVDLYGPCIVAALHGKKRITETVHVDFDELTAMASKHSSSGPSLHEMTPATISS